jgi:chromosomal replication initiation ATPase DnaA
MIRQLTFDLPVRTARALEDFFISPSNGAAVELISADWPGGRLLLVGPKGSGKTHLAHVWARDWQAEVANATGVVTRMDELLARAGGALVIENVDAIAGDTELQEALFHLLNAQAGAGGRLLLTSRVEPGQMGLTLPDLVSRLQGAASARLDLPDDALLGAVVVKLFRDRQIDITPETVSYLVARAERSFEAVHHIVDALDQLSLSEKRAVTRQLVARVLDKPDDLDAL